MPFEIVRNDITKMQVDAIVNAANNRLDVGGGVCGAIHAAAGPKLYEECMLLNGCRTGEAKITKGYDLPAKYVIHTVGPVWQGGSRYEPELLRKCYRNSMLLAKEYGLSSIAFPLISSGIYGYPKDKALKVATDAIRDFLIENDEEIMVYLVVFDKKGFQISEKLYKSVAQYVNDRYVEEHTDHMRRQVFLQAQVSQKVMYDMAPAPARTLEDALSMIDESFSQMLIRKIDEKGLTDPMCYKRANIDRKLFNKIKNDIHYKPRKATALALAIALEMNISDTNELLLKAGLALSHSEKFDIIVEYFILNGQYDIFEINDCLYHFDQPLLGGRM